VQRNKAVALLMERAQLPEERGQQVEAELFVVAKHK
jgi:hypothetical protein